MESLALAPPEVTTSLDAAAWDRFVEEHPEASGYHLSAWRSIFEDVFGHRTLNLSAVREGRVAGILPLVEFRSRLFGRFAVSLPFVINSVSGLETLLYGLGLDAHSESRG